MVVLFVTSTFKDVVNGPAKFANLLLELNARPNLTLYILTEDVDKDFFVSGAVSKYAEYVIPIRIPPSILNRYFGMVARNRVYAREIAQFVGERGKPDVILVNNAVYGLSIQNSINAPVLGMINDYHSLEFDKLNIAFGYQYIRLKIFQFFEMRAIRRLTGIVVNSNYMMDLIKELQPDQEKIYRLYKSVSTVISERNELTDYSGGIRVLFVKSDFQRGGLIDLIAALALIDRPFSVSVIGPPVEVVSKHFPKDKLPKNVQLNLLGVCTQETVFAEMIQHHVYCTPSRLEALGVGNMEALIHGTPVVYTNIGGVPEVMQGEQNGWPAEVSNPTSIAAAIESCLVQPEERQRRVVNGSNYIKENFSKKSMLDALENILNVAVNRFLS